MRMNMPVFRIYANGMQQEKGPWNRAMRSGAKTVLINLSINSGQIHPGLSGGSLCISCNMLQKFLKVSLLKMGKSFRIFLLQGIRKVNLISLSDGNKPGNTVDTYVLSVFYGQRSMNHVF